MFYSPQMIRCDLNICERQMMCNYTTCTTQRNSERLQLFETEIAVNKIKGLDQVNQVI
jgi:hypothetical protein